MHAHARIVGVSPSVAGRAVVSEDELAKKLGRAAWLVWQILASKRDREGVSRCYGKALTRAQGFQTVSRGAAHKALRRLEQAGLIERIGYQTLPTGTKIGVRKMPVYTRRVLGARLLGVASSAAQMAVPAITAQWMARSPGWGGARKGAGRTADHERRQRSNAIQEESGDLVFKGSPIIYITKSVGKKGLTESLRPSDEEDCAPGGASSVSFSETDLGSTIAGNNNRPVIVTAIGGGVPPFPGQAIVAPATVPNPPVYKESDSPEHLAQTLLDSYYGALEVFFDQRFPRKRGAVRRHKEYKLLRTFAAQLVAHEIPPAIWCMFRIERYAKAPAAKTKGRPAYPPVSFICNAKAINEDRWQFRAAWGDARVGGRAVFGPKHKALISRYREMHAAIVRGASRKDAKKEFFPGDAYDRMVDAARIEAVETLNKLITRAARGEFLWL